MITTLVNIGIWLAVICGLNIALSKSDWKRELVWVIGFIGGGALVVLAIILERTK